MISILSRFDTKLMITIRSRSDTYPFSGPTIRKIPDSDSGPKQIPFRNTPDNDISYSPSDNNLPFLVAIPATTAKIEEKETWTTEEEMLLPRTLEIKFGEEYSSSEHYIAIHVLLFHDDAKKNLQNDK